MQLRHWRQPCHVTLFIYLPNSILKSLKPSAFPVLVGSFYFHLANSYTLSSISCLNLFLTKLYSLLLIQFFFLLTQCLFIEAFTENNNHLAQPQFCLTKDLFLTPFVIQVLYSPAHPFFALHHPLYMGNQKHRRHSTYGFVNALHNTFSMSLYPPKILFLAHHRMMFAVFIVRNCEIDIYPPSKNLTFLNWETSC